MSTRRDLEQIAELAPRVANYYTTTDLAGQTVWDRIGLAMQGHPSAGRWDLERSSGTPWCWSHGCDLRDCHDQDRTGCDVENIKVNDPTGEAAARLAINGDRAADDEFHARKHIATIIDLLVKLEDIGSRHPPARPANAWERQQTADANDRFCESCARHHVAKGVPWVQDVYDKCPNRTTVGDILPEPLHLCRFCYDHVWSRGCLPNADELKFRETYQGQDRRLRCPHPKIDREDVA